MDPDRVRELYAHHIEDLSRRTGAVMAEAGFDQVVVHSGSLKLRSVFDDQYWPLRVTPHFQHWLPLAEADCALVLRPSKKPLLFWYKSKSFWERPPPPPSLHFLSFFEIVEFDDLEKLKELLPSGSPPARTAFLGEDEKRATEWGFSNEQLNPHPLVGRLDRLRVVKTPYEAACLEEANRLAAVGHEALLTAFRGGDHSEFDLHLLFLRATGQDDSETPYKNIVALGANAATLHHISYGRRKTSRQAESLLVDAGATYLGYCSDITRTWLKGDGATLAAFEGIVSGVEKMQKALCDDVKLGAPYEKLHEESHRQVGNILRGVGLVDMGTDEMIEAGITRAFFPHGLGHSLGVQCHDVGCALIKPKPENEFLRNTSTIVAGQCFTIEPGIYFIERLMTELREGPNGQVIDTKLLDALMPLGGVRIEDDLVVGSDDGAHKNLTRPFLPLGGGR